MTQIERNVKRNSGAAHQESKRSLAVHSLTPSAPITADKKPIWPTSQSSVAAYPLITAAVGTLSYTV